MTMPRSGAWILLVSLAAPAAAQDAGDFGPLLGVIEPGDDIRVALTGDGLVRAAQVVRLTPGALSVRIQGRQLDLDRGDVLSVRYGVDDPTRDGAWRGFAAGAGGGLLMSYAMCTRLDLCPTPPASVLLVAGLFGAAGAWIGVGVDGLTQTEVSWPATTRGAWGVAPLLAPDRRGVAVTLGFEHATTSWRSRGARLGREGAAMRFLRNMSVVAAALASSGCLTLYGGVRQPIIVSSSPAGAQVFLDGEPVGAAPVEVAVDRGSEPTFLVESDGFKPTALRLRRRVNPWIAVDLAVGALAFYATGAALLGGSEGDLSSPLTLLAVLAGAAPALVDFNSGAAYAFPRRAHAVLRPTARDWSALSLKPSSQESVRPVQPDRGVLRRRPWPRQPGGRIMPFTGRQRESP